MWSIAEEDLECLAVGAGILGCGGGGNPYRGKLLARQHLRRGAAIRVVPLQDVPDDALAVEVFNIGAPVIGLERIPRGDEAYVALLGLEKAMGRKVTHLVPAEIGGSNSTLPLVVAALSGLPVVDCDGMGRAFPELQQSTFMIGGAAVAPAVLADYRHATVTLEGVEDAWTLERLARAVTVAMGGAASMACTPMSGAELRRLAIPSTLTRACELGRRVRSAARPVEAVGGRLLHEGQVTRVERRLEGGFVRGRVELDELVVEFQNENLIARRGSQVLATVPDLIALVDPDTAEPITTELVRYGLRAAVLVLPAPPQLRTPAALAVVGPRAFGYDCDYSG